MNADWETALTSIAHVLQRVATSVLPRALDRRFLDLGERKEGLRPEEREELMAWVAFTQEHSIKKAAAEVALRRLAVVRSELSGV